MYEPSCSRLRPKWDMGVEQRRHEISRSLPSGIAACSDLHPAGGGSPSIPLPQFQQRSISSSTSLLQLLQDHDIGSPARSEEHTSELQSLMRISYAVFCLTNTTTYTYPLTTQLLTSSF